MSETTKRFVFHNTNYAQSHKMSEFRERFITLGEELDGLPDSREKAVALSKLEECSMFTNACIARHPVEEKFSCHVL